MNFPINRDTRRAWRQIASTLFAFLLMMIIAAGTILAYEHYNPIYRASHPASLQPVEDIHRIDQQANARYTPIPTPTSNPMIVQRTIWVKQETALLNIPGIGPEIAHVGLHFPLTLWRNPIWMVGTLWYPVQWSTPTSTTSGWVSATTVTFTPPAKARAWASLDVLAPHLMTYLAPFGPHVGVAVYDVTHQRSYTYQGRHQFLTASSMKVPIMLAFLDMIEQQRREPNDEEMTLLTTMIEHSDNDAASTLYFDEIGGAAGITSFLKQYGITGLTPNANSWGYSLITPQAMVNLLTLLQQGKILTEQHRTLALSLMEHVDVDQRTGVGDTVPAGTIVAMKNGWVPGPDSLWVINSSGIVMGQKETYIIAVYTQGQPSFADGQALTQTICRAIASALLKNNRA